MVDSTLKNGIVVDRGDRKTEGRRGKRHGGLQTAPELEDVIEHFVESFRFDGSMVETFA